MIKNNLKSKIRKQSIKRKYGLELRMLFPSTQGNIHRTHLNHNHRCCYNYSRKQTASNKLKKSIQFMAFEISFIFLKSNFFFLGLLGSSRFRFSLDGRSICHLCIFPFQSSSSDTLHSRSRKNIWLEDRPHIR